MYFFIVPNTALGDLDVGSCVIWPSWKLLAEKYPAGMKSTTPKALWDAGDCLEALLIL
jgi:hypothetical protein